MAKEIGRRLLELADHPRDVQWTTYPKAGFAIPLELFARFDAEETAETDDTETAERKPQRRRGRPRKEETSTDNNTSEEG